MRYLNRHASPWIRVTRLRENENQFHFANVATSAQEPARNMTAGRTPAGPFLTGVCELGTRICWLEDSQ